LKSEPERIFTSVISIVSSHTPQPWTTSVISLLMASRSYCRFLMISSIVEFAIQFLTIADAIEVSKLFAVKGTSEARSAPKFLYAFIGPSPIRLMVQQIIADTSRPYISFVTCWVEN
jgi:hypothetical protein